jgi:hypothetical protein
MTTKRRLMTRRSEWSGSAHETFTQYFEPVVVDHPESFCAAKVKYTSNAYILRNSVSAV